MKIHLSLFILMMLHIGAQETKKPKYPYRPNTEFYEVGKEKLRQAEYLKHKDSIVSKKYLRLFTSKKYDQLSIYQASVYFRINRKITINKMVLYATYKKTDPVYKQFENFFKISFPEKVRRIPDANNKGQILVFSGKQGRCVVFVPGILGPEFAIVDGASKGLSIGKTYGLSNYGMSAMTPFKDFWKMYGDILKNE